MPATVRQPARARADPARPGRTSRGRGRRRPRGRRGRPGRRRGERHGPRRRHRPPTVPARPVPRRRGRGPQRGSRAAGHAVRGARGVLEQHDDLLHRRPAAADVGQAVERDLHQQPDVRGLLPARQELRVRLPGGQHGRRPDDGRGGRRGVGHEREPADRARAGRSRRARPRRHHRRARPLALDRRRRPAVTRRAGSSSPATPPTSCRRTAGSEGTPASTMLTTWPGSSPWS